MSTIFYFLRAVSRDLVALLSGIASLIIALIVSWVSPTYAGLWWSVAYLCILLAAFRVWQSEWQKPGPQVVIEYDHALSKEIKQWRVGESPEDQYAPQSVKLINLSDYPALNVRINDAQIGAYTAIFETVPRLLKGDQISPSVSFGEIDKYIQGHIGTILESILHLSESNTLTVPLTVSYEDFNGRKFQTECEIRHTATNSTCIKKRYRRQ